MPVTLVKKKPEPPAKAAIAVSDVALMQARAIGLYGNVVARLRRMARRSAPLTHDEGNRRFADFVLQVQDNQVLAVNRL